MSNPVKLIIIGCGSRGHHYANWLLENPGRAEIVAIAEPRDYYRKSMGDTQNIPENMRFRTWEEITARPKFADAVLICTQDSLHEEPAVACAGLGYHIMLEKPMATTAEGCRRIAEAVKRNNVMLSVCHVMRYTNYTRMVKKIVSSGMLGDIVSMQHLEPVRPYHQAHSYVRGNWRNEAESSFMLLAKCCHDLDWIRYIMDKKCVRTQSFGSLKYFRPENKPEGAAERCTECPTVVESGCPYSAIKIYIRDRFNSGYGKLWPLDIVTPDVTREGLTKALSEGPYGRCVFACDNDVVDHQVVNMEFEDGSSAQMTMTAFCDEAGRQTRIFGTKGCLRGDDNKVWVTDYLTNETKIYDSNVANDGGINSGHGGGDGGIMNAFITALETGDASNILSGTDVSLESHLMCFKAEESRLNGTVCEIK